MFTFRHRIGFQHSLDISIELEYFDALYITNAAVAKALSSIIMAFPLRVLRLSLCDKCCLEKYYVNPSLQSIRGKFAEPNNLTDDTDDRTRSTDGTFYILILQISLKFKISFQSKFISEIEIDFKYRKFHFVPPIPITLILISHPIALFQSFKILGW
ncbi:8026_t:CDS:1 [Funneliformis mosseae]|uniref:8026_t:CDS:1 n=1 Tax=Funneliformis mosseae TaxID=27381 RepID=A0A9N9AF58_FUNMO|nr:8026_t:CDS:1 [Funneliformis mosseae]